MGPQIIDLGPMNIDDARWIVEAIRQRAEREPSQHTSALAAHFDLLLLRS